MFYWRAPPANEEKNYADVMPIYASDGVQQISDTNALSGSGC